MTQSPKVQLFSARSLGVGCPEPNRNLPATRSLVRMIMASELQIFGDIAEPKKVLVLQQMPKVQLDTLLERAHQIREESTRIQGEVEELSKAISQAAARTAKKGK